MIRTILRALAAMLGLGASAVGAEAATGFQLVSIAVPGDEPLAAAIWYPSDAAPTAHKLGMHSAMLAVDGPVRGAAMPLVVMSHGSGGSFVSQYPTAMALAGAGFVVAAVTHTGDTGQDHSRRLAVIDRPAHMSRLVDYMLDEWPQRGVIDAGRIGVIGYSVGAFTALVSVGGVPDLRRLTPHCDANPQEPVCRVLRDTPGDVWQLNDGSGKSWTHDARIKAAVVAAPALAFVFGREGLAHVTVPIQLWRGAADADLPEPWYGEALMRDLPVKPEYHVVPRANHIAFLAPCAPDVALAHPMVCQDPPGFDRAAFNVQFNAQILRFLRSALGVR